MSYEVLRSKESLEPDGFLAYEQRPTLRIATEPAPVKPLSYAEKLERTTSVPTTTHTTINGDVYRVDKLPELFGFTHEQLFQARLAKLATATHCTLEGKPVSLDCFEALHNIQLGQE